MEESARPKHSDGQVVTKRLYEKPELTVYGDLRLRTLTRSSGPSVDGGAHPNNKTG